MKFSTAMTLAISLLAGSALSQEVNQHSALKGPIDDSALSWAPTKWGKDDRAGSANHTKNSANIAKALATIKQNKAITIGKHYHSEAPGFGPRKWNMWIPGTPTGGPFGKNALVYHDELVTTQIGQIQTQFDGPGHIGVNTTKGPVFYNGVISWDAYERGPGNQVVGMGPLGVEHVGELGFVCRLIVLDAVAYRKSQGKLSSTAEMLPVPKQPGDIGIVTADDVQAMVKAQGLKEIGSGDCVALHTGQGNTWGATRYKSMNSEQRAAARDRDAAHGAEPGLLGARAPQQAEGRVPRPLRAAS